MGQAKEEKSAFDQMRDELDRHVQSAEWTREKMLERLEEAEKGMIVNRLDRLADRLDEMNIKINQLIATEK